jgi:hypothetical protein
LGKLPSAFGSLNLPKGLGPLQGRQQLTDDRPPGQAKFRHQLVTRERWAGVGYRIGGILPTGDRLGQGDRGRSFRQSQEHGRQKSFPRRLAKLVLSRAIERRLAIGR